MTQKTLRSTVDRPRLPIGYGIISPTLPKRKHTDASMSAMPAVLLDPLTEREQEILQLLCNRYSNNEIADHLSLSLNTVKWYNRQIYSKLGVSNRREVAEYAEQLGLSQPTHPAPTFTPEMARSTRTIAISPLLTNLPTDAGIAPSLDPNQYLVDVPEGEVTPAIAARRNRKRMLDNVREFWIDGVLQHSLYNQLLLDLGVRDAPQKIESSAASYLHTATDTVDAPPRMQHILHIFDQAKGKLLITGEPGSGKTTTLLHLTQHLIDRAEADFEYPIPVILNLSSWGEAQPLLGEWLIDELNSKYQVSHKVARDWVEHDSLILLLDGLDEVAKDHQAACVTAINNYSEEHRSADIVVCSRAADYERLQEHLHLNHAITLQALTPEQVDDYLTHFGDEVMTIRQMLDRDPSLYEVIDTPLLLHVLLVAYHGNDKQEIIHFDSIEEQRKHLFSVYIERMFQRRETTAPYSPEQTRGYLGWLANKMVGFSRTVFQIEGIQPTWLNPAQYRRYTRQMALAFMIVFAILLSLNRIFVTFFGVYPSNIELKIVMWFGIGLLWGYVLGTDLWKNALYGAIFASAGGLIVELGNAGEIPFNPVVFTARVLVYAVLFLQYRWVLKRRGVDRDYVRTVDRLYFSWRSGSWRLTLAGVFIGIFLGISHSISTGLTLSTNQAILSLSLGAIVAGFVFWLFSCLSSNQVEQTTYPNQGIRQSLQQANFIGAYEFLAMVVIAIAIGLPTGRIPGAIVFSLFVAFMGWLVYGGYGVIQHVILRRILQQDGDIPKNYADFLNHASDLVFLRRVGGGYIFIHRYLLEHFGQK